MWAGFNLNSVRPLLHFLVIHPCLGCCGNGGIHTFYSQESGTNLKKCLTLAPVFMKQQLLPPQPLCSNVAFGQPHLTTTWLQSDTVHHSYISSLSRPHPSSSRRNPAVLPASLTLVQLTRGEDGPIKKSSYRAGACYLAYTLHLVALSSVYHSGCK